MRISFTKWGGGRFFLAFFHGIIIFLQLFESCSVMYHFMFTYSRCKLTEENVMFLKTHKTGSSTITSILNRYADLHELTMLLPKNKLNRFMWPQLFKATSVERTYLIKDTQANMLANHARYLYIHTCVHVCIFHLFICQNS